MVPVEVQEVMMLSYVKVCSGEVVFMGSAGAHFRTELLWLCYSACDVNTTFSLRVPLTTQHHCHWLSYCTHYLIRWQTDQTLLAQSYWPSPFHFVFSSVTHSSQPSSSCSPAGRCWASALCTHAWCHLWPPASSEGFWTTGRSSPAAPLAYAAPW